MEKTGTVLWFNNAKGFGFIKQEDGSADIFVHFTAIARDGYKSLAEGDVVTYVTETGPGGRPQAGKVRKQKKAA